MFHPAVFCWSGALKSLARQTEEGSSVPVHMSHSGKTEFGSTQQSFQPGGKCQGPISWSFSHGERERGEKK